MAQRQNNREDDSRALVVQAPRLPFPANDARGVGITAQQWKALTDAIYPSAKTVDGVMLALNYCKARGLDPFKRCVHVVPMWNTALGREVETVWPGIAELRTTASRTGSHAGNDDCVFGPSLNRAFKDSAARGRGQNKYVDREECPTFDFPEWAQVTVYRIVGGQRVPFVGPKVRFVEVFSGVKGLRVPNARWRLAPFQMLEKCAEAAALRRAFPEEMAGDYTAEEMEGQTIADGGVPIEHQPIMDGGEATHTEEDSGDEGWPSWVQEDFDLQKQNIALTEKVVELKKAKPAVLNHPDRNDWPLDAKAELGELFDRRIQALEPPEVADNDQVDEQTDDQELPLDGEDAGATTDEQPATDDDEEEGGQ